MSQLRPAGIRRKSRSREPLLASAVVAGPLILYWVSCAMHRVLNAGARVHGQLAQSPRVSEVVYSQLAQLSNFEPTAGLLSPGRYSSDGRVQKGATAAAHRLRQLVWRCRV